MLPVVLAVVAAAVVIVLIAAAMKPATFRVVRSRRMQAPAERVFPLINDFHEWAQWSPYEKLDPAMNKTFGGAASGRGSTYAWSGNSKAGQGRMEIVESVPSSRVAIDLQFEKPWRSRMMATFTIESAADGTTVTWAMEGPSQFMGKVMGLFINMDQMIGKDFDAGLGTLRTLAEAGPAQ